VLFGLGKIFRRLDARLHLLPDWLRRYVIALAAETFTVGLAAILLHTAGAKLTLVYSLLGDLLILGSAWLGYGPGILVCTLTTYLVPRILLPNRPSHVDFGRFALLIIISMLISRISVSKRKTEARLRRSAEELENRVQERTRELQLNEQTLREQAQLLDLAPVAILATDQDSVIRVWSRGAEQMYGWTAQEAVGKRAHEFLRTVLPAPLEQIQERLLTTGFWEGELTHTRHDGSTILVMSRWAPQRNANGEACGCLEINTDVTERRRVEEQLRHSQKLESVGLLAGGVAHDFNNLLTVINGYTEMVLGDLPEDSPVRENLTEIRAAGDRAAGLTQQLLAFGRKQLLKPTVLNLNTAVTDVQKMLRRLIGEDIEIVTRLDESLANVKADAGQIQQIIMNLAINARDAMPRGGTLIFETANVTFDETYCADHPEVQVGRTVMLAVTDTGTGMTPEVRAHIFEPFFTTKPKGSGTGLGLATVYGMVKQGGGWIWVYSELGEGTAFKIYLPASDAAIAEVKVTPKTSLQGKETILLVEDQTEVRTLALTALRRYGYTVFEASHGKEALAISKEFPGKINLLVTDVVMPGMTGRELADQLLSLRQGLQVLYMSGYTESAISHRGVLDPDVAYLQKPFTPESLGQKVRDVLGPVAASATILIADDDPAIRKLVAKMLVPAGYAVIEAGNGREAVDLVSRNPQIELLLTDLAMPDQEGIETIQRLRQLYPQLKFIAMSGKFGKDMLEVATKFGAVAGLPKPIERQMLLDTVAKALATGSKTAPPKVMSASSVVQ
jgi:PAS domain S-box-containing protein